MIYFASLTLSAIGDTYNNLPTYPDKDTETTIRITYACAMTREACQTTNNVLLVMEGR
jgi:hypothetical protein